MSTTVVEAAEIERSYLTDKFGLGSWLLTTDHKRIAILYLLSTTMFFFIGGIAAALMRLNSGCSPGFAERARNLQPPVHDARRDHGLVLSRAGGAYRFG